MGAARQDPFGVNRRTNVKELEVRAWEGLSDHDPIDGLAFRIDQNSLWN